MGSVWIGKKEQFHKKAPLRKKNGLKKDHNGA
jgi:hypothetical protein